MKTKEFDIFGTKYTIGWVDEISDKAAQGTTVGLCDSTNAKVWIATKLPNGDTVPKADMEKNLIHELIHAILNEGQYLAVSTDEPLVEWLARCIYSLKKQKVI